MQKLVIDFESSGLERGSYPIEVAWASQGQTPVSYIIRPTAIWLDDARLWDPAAERLHRLSINHLMRNGQPVEEVAAALIEALSDNIVYSNNPLWDQDWLHRLLCAANCDLPVKIHDFNVLLMELTDIEGINRAYHVANEIIPPTHRATQDVLNLWEVYHQCELFSGSKAYKKTC